MGNEGSQNDLLKDQAAAMKKLQEEMIKADEDLENGTSSNNSPMIDLSRDVSSRRNQMSKSTLITTDKNQPKLLDDSGMGYSSF